MTAQHRPEEGRAAPLAASDEELLHVVYSLRDILDNSRLVEAPQEISYEFHSAQLHLGEDRT